MIGGKPCSRLCLEIEDSRARGDRVAHQADRALEDEFLINDR